MSVPTLKTLNGSDRVLSLTQANIQDAIQDIVSSPLVGAGIVTYSATGPIAANTDFSVFHNLGRTPLGIIPTIGTLATTLYVSPSANNSTRTTVILRSTTAVPAGQAFLLFIL